MKELTRSMTLVALVAALGGCATPPEKDPGYKHVLMIGNSFSICCLNHLPSIAESMEQKLDLASLYIGGCSLEQHWENVIASTNELFRPYRFDRCIGTEKVVDNGAMNIVKALKMAKWDVVTIQQASHDSWREESFRPWGDRLVAKIRELAPQARILVQETWSYTPWDSRLEEWKIDQNQMYAKLHLAYAAFAARHSLEIIPFGTAVQEWRRRLPVAYEENSLGGDVVGGGYNEEKDHFKRNPDNTWSPNCDVFHLGRRGEYFQALVWARKLFAASVEDVAYCPDYVVEKEAKLMKEIAEEVVK